MSITALGDTSKDGLLEIVGTSWDYNGTMKVTVREMIGGFNGWNIPEENIIRRMRTLARSALAYPELTRKSPLVNTWENGGQIYATFAVSRLEA